MKKQKLTTILVCVSLALTLAIVAIMSACAQPTPTTPSPTPAPAAKPAPDKIRIGQALCLSGYSADTAKHTDSPTAHYWVDTMNKSGGIYLPEYDKRIPVELIQYDDKSDVATTGKLFEKLITVDKVDLTIPPSATDFHVAAAYITNKYKQPWITYTCGSEKLYEERLDYPYFFTIIAMPEQYMIDLDDYMVSLGVKSVALVYVNLEWGLSCKEIMLPDLETKGIKAVMVEGIAPDQTDLSALLKKAKDLNPDAFVEIGYPPATFGTPQQAAVIGFNPKLMCLGVGTAFNPFLDMYGPDMVEGIMCMGSAWTKDINPEAKQFYDSWVAMYNAPPTIYNAWGIGSYSVLQQAIEKVGLEDLEKLRNYIATNTFETPYGTVKFEDMYNYTHPGQVMQFQNGSLQIVAPTDSKFAVPGIYPKPAWPKK